MRFLSLIICLSVPCWAQSAQLLEAVRAHRPHVAQLAQDELSACLAERPVCGRADHLSFLTGVLLLADAQPADSARQLATRPPPRQLEPIHAWYLGEAQAWSNATAQALKSLKRARTGAPVWLIKRIDLRLAELQLSAGQAARALPTFLAAESSPEVLLDRALTYLALKNPGKAADPLRQLVLRYPTHPHAHTARRLLGDSAIFSDEELLRIAQGQSTQGDPQGALATLALLKVGDSQRALLIKGQALLARGKDAEALAVLDTASSGSSPALAAEATMVRARRLMRLGDNTQASQAFRHLDDTWPHDPNADEAGYLAAWLAMNSGDWVQAIDAFEAFETRHDTSRRRDEARWFRAWSLYRLGRRAEARATCLSLAADFPRSQLVPQALYWAARSAPALTADAGPDGGSLDLRREYRDLVSAFPGTIYALLAVERLRELGEAATLPFVQAPKALTVTIPTALARAALLASIGLTRDANDEIQAALTTMPPADAIAWGHALQTMGDFGTAHTIAAAHLWGATYSLRRPEALALMYPRAWKDSTERAASEAHVDPFFAWAIMRRESTFHPDVLSPADARGLMQLIPPTARQVATEAGLEVPTPDDLYAPEVNVRLATRYLSALFARLSHPGLVAAAYNGGPSAVTKWANAHASQPFDEFIEEIPYRETRGYVKQVVADYFIYQQLYGEKGAAPTLGLTVPIPAAHGVDY